MDPRKTEKADLEQKRGLFFLTGLCISLALVIVAFSWQFESDKLTTRHVLKHEIREDLIQILPEYALEEEHPEAVADAVIDAKAPENAEPARANGAPGYETYEENDRRPAIPLVIPADAGNEKISADRLETDRLSREIRMARVRLQVLHDRLIPEGLPEGMLIPLQEGIYTHTAPMGTYLTYLNVQRRLNALRGDSMQIVIARDRLKKYIDRQTMLNRIEMVRIQMKEAELNEKIAREEALKMYRPYGRPDNSVKVDGTMVTARSFADVLNGRVPGVLVAYDKGQPVTSIRGSSVSLYLLNGMPVEQAILNSMPISSISNIDVLKSPEQTAFYGSRGAGGVINVITAMPSGVPMTAEQLKRQEDLELSVEQRRHLVEAKERKMSRDQFAAEWIRDHNRDNAYAEELLDLKIYRVKWCACKAHYCNGWRMEYDDEKFTAWMKNKAPARESIGMKQ